MKKILIFAHPEQDFLSYMIHHGLCKIYGGDNVITYPFKRSHYGLVDDKYLLDDGKVGYTAPSQFMEALEGREYTSGEIADLIKKQGIEFAICESPRTHAVKGADEFKDLLAGYNVPLVLCDGDDGTNIRTDVIDKLVPLVYFKRELTVDHELGGIFPLPFSSFIDTSKYPDKEKDIDVFFSVGMTHGRRNLILDRLIQLRGDLSVHVADDSNRLSFDEYIDKMSRAKVNVICRGHGWDTVRRFEAASFSGIVLSDKIPIITPNTFEDGKHIIHYEDDLSDLVDKVLFYVNNNDKRKEIGEAGRKHLLEYHTTKKRAEHMIEKIRDMLF